MQLQDAPRFLVDLCPRFTDNGSFLALQQIHHLLPFKLPIPSDSEVLYDFPELASPLPLAPPSPLPPAPPKTLLLEPEPRSPLPLAPPPASDAASTSVIGPLEFR